MSDLKPCPFCGGAAEIEREGTSRQSCIVRCEECGTALESNEQGHGDGWNRRPTCPFCQYDNCGCSIQDCIEYTHESEGLEAPTFDNFGCINWAAKPTH